MSETKKLSFPRLKQNRIKNNKKKPPVLKIYRDVHSNQIIEHGTSVHMIWAFDSPSTTMRWVFVLSKGQGFFKKKLSKSRSREGSMLIFVPRDLGLNSGRFWICPLRLLAVCWAHTSREKLSSE